MSHSEALEEMKTSMFSRGLVWREVNHTLGHTVKGEDKNTCLSICLTLSGLGLANKTASQNRQIQTYKLLTAVIFPTS